jgi:acetate kinase
MSNAILVINAGSSSSKFSVFGTEGGLHVITKGQVEGIGVGIEPHFSASNAAGESVADAIWPTFEVGKRHSSLLRLLIDWIEGHLQGATLRAVGHRVVHGGSGFTAPVRVTPEVVEQLNTLIPLAPLHQPHNVGPIATLAQLHPDLPQVACFDTAFHATKRNEASLLGLPRRFLDAGIRRYGFHGLSYEYIADALCEIAPEVAKGRVIVAHLGSGASMCALKNGKSVDSSMGFTAVDGLMMGTRTGSLDPGVVLHMVQAEGMDGKAIEKLLYKESGLLGVSGGISSDMRVLLDSDDPNAREAVDLFVYRIAKEIGALTMAIGGIDALVFTAGIGEHSAEIRKRVIEQVAWLGITLSPEANLGNGPCLSTPDSAVSAWSIPTNEELMIARHTQAMIFS